MSTEWEPCLKPRQRQGFRLPWGTEPWKVFLLLSILANVCTSYIYFKHTSLKASAHAQVRVAERPYSQSVQRGLSSTSGSISSTGRSLSSNSTSNSTSTHGSAHAGHKAHQHDALLFLFNAILIGTTVLWLTSVFPWMQLSIILFVIGTISSLILEGLKVKNNIGVWGVSYMMWMDIDPHLLLFTMLPTLLAGDAMTIDTHVATRVSKQCLFLAGPGVLVSGMVTAMFLMKFLDWSFLLSLVTGSILCATDPVAVVALLKELGASPTLTVQIQGESLLNDGTAIVLYTIAYDMLSGQEYDVADMAMFLVKTAIMGLALGVFLGYFFFSWIRAANDRFNHASPVIQILLTMCAAYWSFVIAEGVLKMSGVLSTVACSIVLAHHMWPHVVDREAMIDFWHVMENLGNIIIFVLGGALVGAAMVHINPIDYLNLIVIYLFLIVLRAIMIFCSRPVLRLLHPDRIPLTWEDATVMSWGGLRGAVGLALAMQVHRGKATDADGVAHLTQDDADRVLFFVAGTAFLTTCVNASTCPILVAWLGITALPKSEAMMLAKFNQQLVHFSEVQDNPPEVTARLGNMLAGIAHEILLSKKHLVVKKKTNSADEDLQSNQSIIGDYQLAVRELAQIPAEDKAKLERLPETFDGEVDKAVHLLQGNINPDPDMCKIVNKTFLTMVNTNYWKQIEEGELRPGSDESDLLFTSIRFSDLKLDLEDFQLLEGLADKKKGFSRISRVVEEVQKKKVTEKVAESISSVGALVSSSGFNISCALAIVFNVLYVVIEESARNPSNEDSSAWITIEAFFTFLFFLEFVIKFAHIKCGYFLVAWNCFDFFLVVLGALGLGMNVLALDDKSAASQSGSESRVIRIARVLRTMRFLRLFRLFHARLSADKHVSPEVIAVMKSMSIMKSFIRAHLDSQQMILKFFTDSIDETNEIELARCLLQSQVSVHNAVIAAVRVYRRDKELFEDIKMVLNRKHIVEDLQQFIEAALEDGAISSTNAGLILHPMAHEVHDCIAYINKKGDGIDTVNPALDGFGDYDDSQPRYEDIHSIVAYSPQKAKTEEGDLAAGVNPAKTKGEANDAVVSIKPPPDASSPREVSKIASPNEEEPDGEPFLAGGNHVDFEDATDVAVAVKRFKPKAKRKVKKRAADERQTDEVLEENGEEPIAPVGSLFGAGAMQEAQTIQEDELSA